MSQLISVIIPAFNEEKTIGGCLNSIKNQSYKQMEIIVVDDGSSDSTRNIVKGFSDIKLLTQSHKGPGQARNLGASNAKGEILIFVDADMTFDKNFIGDLVKPIVDEKTIGTFSKNEMVKNKDNVWSNCWNINKNLPRDRMIPDDYPNHAPVFRAILKKEFERVNGFETSGQYTDDWSLSRKLGRRSMVASGAVYYHSNPESLKEIWKQARWIGKNEFLSGDLPRKIKSLFFYSFPVSFTFAILKSFMNLNVYFQVFKIVYDFGVFVSVMKSFIGESKAK